MQLARDKCNILPWLTAVVDVEAVFAFGGFPRRDGCVFFLKSAEVDRRPIHAYVRVPFPIARIPIHAVSPGLVVRVQCSIPHVYFMRHVPEISHAIVRNVAVDVIQHFDRQMPRVP